MRGTHTGALGRTYLHSPISEALLYAVAESERLFDARLLHGVMLAALYANPRADIDSGNEQVFKMYLDALGTVPYLSVATKKVSCSATDELVAEWRRMNEGALAEAGGGGEEAGDV